MDDHGYSWIVMIVMEHHGWTWNKWMKMEGYGRTRMTMDIHGWTRKVMENQMNDIAWHERLEMA